MKTREKWYATALAAVIVAAAAITEDPGILAFGIAATITLWLIWRAFVFLRLLLAPVRERFQPQISALNDHVDVSLRRSGLGRVADMAKALDGGLDGAVNATQRAIDERNKLH